MKIKIKVTQAILEESSTCGIGIPKEKAQTTKAQMIVATNCAIALAVQEIFPVSLTASTRIVIPKEGDLNQYIENIESGYANFIPEEFIERLYAYTIILPIEATTFIREFDNSTFLQRRSLKPISFDIDVPNELIDRIGIPQVYKILSESKTLELVNI